MRAARLTQLLGLALAALLTLTATGLPGAVHHLAEHAPHAVPFQTHSHDHACHHHGSQDDQHTPTDEPDHEGSDCELCLMLAQAGKWGGWSASTPMLLEAPRAPVAVEHASAVLTRTPGVLRTRGPPTPAC